MNSSIRWHAILMIAGWISCVTSGILIARFGKTFWPDRKVLGMNFWFGAHRILMVTGWLLTLASMIVIFIHADYVFHFRSHAIIGYVAFILATSQILNSFLRPAPGGSKRWIFNIGHWFIGMTAHFLALNNIIRSLFSHNGAGIIIAYVLVYLGFSDALRKLTPHISKLSTFFKTFFFVTLLVINGLAIFMIYDLL